MDLVTVVIPSYNRFESLCHAIYSVDHQTHPAIEIIIVNDCSSDPNYREFDFSTLVHSFPGHKRALYTIHLAKNSKLIDPLCAGGAHARNIGMMQASGKYIAFLDDDDYFLPQKLSIQILHMKKMGVFFSCTEALTGKGVFNPSMHSLYQTWHFQGIHWKTLQEIFQSKGKLPWLHVMFKDPVTIWNKNMIDTHNCICNSTVVISSEFARKGHFFALESYGEDWTYWKMLLQFTDCAYIREPLTYLDSGHSTGRNY